MAFVFGQGIFGQGFFGGGPGPAPLPGGGPIFSSHGYTATIGTNPTTGDLSLSGLKIIRGDEAIEQKVRQVLKFFEGEWFLDTRLGMPYVREIFSKKNPSIPVIKAIFRRALLKVQQITEVRSMDLTIDRRIRQGTLTFVAILDDTRTLTAEAEPFILP